MARATTLPPTTIAFEKAHNPFFQAD